MTDVCTPPIVGAVIRRIFVSLCSKRTQGVLSPRSSIQKDSNIFLTAIVSLKSAVFFDLILPMKVLLTSSVCICNYASGAYLLLVNKSFDLLHCLASRLNLDLHWLDMS